MVYPAVTIDLKSLTLWLNNPGPYLSVYSEGGGLLLTTSFTARFVIPWHSQYTLTNPPIECAMNIIGVLSGSLIASMYHNALGRARSEVQYV